MIDYANLIWKLSRLLYVYWLYIHYEPQWVILIDIPRVWVSSTINDNYADWSITWAHTMLVMIVMLCIALCYPCRCDQCDKYYWLIVRYSQHHCDCDCTFSYFIYLRDILIIIKVTINNVTHTPKLALQITIYSSSAQLVIRFVN